ncbi:MAG: tetratricopeptide repeat-containing sensor histidine kinase [Flavobacteriaceae bacterium]
MSLKKIIVIILFLTPLFLCAQKNKKLSIFFSAINEKSGELKTSKGFQKAKTFFLQKKWDSTLIFTSKQLNIDTSNFKQNNYMFFFRAYSFKRKKLFKQAKKEFAKITKEFDFYNRINMYLGEIELELRKFEKAITHFKKVVSLETYDMVGVRRGSIENNIGLCYLHLELFDKAEDYLSKSIKSVELTKDTVKLIGSYGNIAATYYEQLMDKKAIPYFQKAYQLAKKVQDYELKRNTALNMAVVEEGRKGFAKALMYRKEYEKWKDSLNDQNRIYETAQLEKKIAVEQKQGEVNLLQAENKLKDERNKVYLYSGVLLLMLLIILFTSYKGKVKRNKIITAQKEDLDELNATKDKLFSVVSHDLRSSVNAIKTSNKNLLINLETENTSDLKETLQQNSAIVNGAYGLLDNLLNWALLQTQQSFFEITSQRLLILVDHVAYNYKPLMQEKKIVFENRVDKSHVIEVDQESLKIILRNIIDNAIKFSKSEGSIQIYSRENDAFCDLIVEDSGIGMEEATINELLKETQLLSKKKNEEILGTGLGLHLVKSMIQKNNGKFSIESTPGKGTKMIISLPKTNSNG